MVASVGIDAWVKMTFLYEYDIRIKELHFIMHVKWVIFKLWNV